MYNLQAESENFARTIVLKYQLDFKRMRLLLNHSEKKFDELLVKLGMDKFRRIDVINQLSQYDPSNMENDERKAVDDLEDDTVGKNSAGRNNV